MPVYNYAVRVFVSMPVHVYGQSDRSWAAVIIDFNAYWATLPTGGGHKILAGSNYGLLLWLTNYLSQRKQQERLKLF